MNILILLLIIPVALVVAWKMIGIFLALISDIGGLITSILVFAIIVILGIFLGKF